MFKELIYNSSTGETYKYILIDDLFKETLLIPKTFNAYTGYTGYTGYSRPCVIKEIIYCYQRRMLHFIPSIAAVYDNYFFPNMNCSGYLKSDRDWLDLNYPSLSYGKKYYPCVVNHLKRFRYANGYSF